MLEEMIKKPASKMPSELPSESTWELTGGETFAGKMTAVDLGRFLKEKRLDKEVALTTISNQTKISTAALESIEEGQFTNLHGDVFVRGFLRSYAECLGLNPKDVVAKYASCSDGLAPAPVSAAEKKGFLTLLKENNAEKKTTFRGDGVSLTAAFEAEAALAKDDNEDPQKNHLFMTAAFLMLGSIALMSYWMVVSSSS